jgi:hypothetical protein
MRFHRGFLSLSLSAALVSCERGQIVKVAQIRADSAAADSIARARQDSVNRAQPGYIIDSVLPVEEELRRFREALGGVSVTKLSSGSESREALVRRLVRAVAAQDSSDIRAMMLTAREFADLVYPSSPYTRPPYRQTPGLVWRQITDPSTSGFKRLLARRGGVQFQYEGHTCKSQPERQGDNLIWTECQLRLLNPARETTTQRWFGSIIERDGVFKFVSLSNQF